MADPARVEAMNASPTHPKVRIKLQVSANTFIAGEDVTGKMEMECRADGFGGSGKTLAMGSIGVELIGTQELLSRDHSGISTFLHSSNVFQGPGLPPSNAVHPFASMPEHVFGSDDALPRDYFPARKGMTTFFFRFAIPPTLPASIEYKGIARVKYAIRAFCQVLYRGEIRLVTGHLEVSVVEGFDEDAASRKDIDRTSIGENGRMWIQGRVPGGYVVAGFPGVLNVHIRNGLHQSLNDLELSLVRQLHLQAVDQPHISDVLFTRRFNSLEYSTPPLGEGSLALDFDVPKNCCGVKGGDRIGIGRHGKRSVVGALFDIRCIIKVLVKGTSDTILEVPIEVLHPAVVPEIPPSPFPYSPHHGYPHHPHHHPHHNHQHQHQHHGHQHTPIYSPPLPSNSPGISTPILYPPNHVSIPDALEAASHEYRLAPWGDPYMVHQPSHWGPDNVLDAEYQELHNRYGSPIHQNDHPPDPNYDNEWHEPPDFNYWQRNLSPQPVPPSDVPLQAPPTEYDYASETEVTDEDRPLARRVSHHLRVANIFSGRGRSVSPPPVRPPELEPEPLQDQDNNLVTPKRALRPRHSFDGSPLSSGGARPRPIAVPRHTFDGAVPISPASSISRSPSILSPRPVLSPRTSFEHLPSKDGVGSAKSEDVDLLERMADSGLAMKDKTLPAPPSATSTVKQDSKSPIAKQSTDSQVEEEDEVDMKVLLEREGVKPLSYKHGQDSQRVGAVGLDALERRLLKDVGTRKVSGTKNRMKGSVRAGVFTLAGQPKPDLPLPLPQTRSRIASLEASSPLERKLLQAVGTRKGPPTPDKDPDPLSQLRSQDPFLTPQGSALEKKDVEAEVRRLRKDTPSRVREWLGTVDLNVNGTTGTTQKPAPNLIDSPTPARSSDIQLETQSPLNKNKRQLNQLAVLEAKYDIRSARGGKGGIVTSVAAIWGQQGSASTAAKRTADGSSTPTRPMKGKDAQADSPVPESKSPNPRPKLPALLSPTHSEPRAAAKSSPPSHNGKSPAVAHLSTKPAKPVISSTATLIRPISSRPSPSGSTTGAVRMAMPTISEIETSKQTDIPKYPPAAGQGEAGKARLKALIRKYEAQAAKS